MPLPLLALNAQADLRLRDRSIADAIHDLPRGDLAHQPIDNFPLRPGYAATPYPDHDPRILKAMADRPGTMTTQRSVYETLPGRDSHVRQVYLQPDREQNGSYTLDGTFLAWDEPATDHHHKE